MKVLLVGYGKMGKIIESILLQRGHEIAGRIDPSLDKQFDFLTPCDVAIEFTTPESAVGNIRACLDHHIPVVCGTTGWLEHRKEIDEYCTRKSGTFFYASNYSLGVNIFFKLNELLAKMMDGRAGYEVSIEETHHTQKKDAPSGTAITLAEGIMKRISGLKRWVSGRAGKPDEIGIESFRLDPYPGKHVVKYRSPIDDIEISHTAHSREGFALGAVLVAEWIIGKKGVLGMEDFLSFGDLTAE